MKRESNALVCRAALCRRHRIACETIPRHWLFRGQPIQCIAQNLQAIVSLREGRAIPSYCLHRVKKLEPFPVVRKNIKVEARSVSTTHNSWLNASPPCGTTLRGTPQSSRNRAKCVQPHNVNFVNQQRSIPANMILSTNYMSGKIGWS